MTLPKVHLRKPCYDFYFLFTHCSHCHFSTLQIPICRLMTSSFCSVLCHSYCAYSDTAIKTELSFLNAYTARSSLYRTDSDIPIARSSQVGLTYRWRPLSKEHCCPQQIGTSSRMILTINTVEPSESYRSI